MRKLVIYMIIAFLMTGTLSLEAQTRTVGVFLNETSKVYDGYTLFAPKQNTMTYLINNEGRIINQWTASKLPPGQAVYLLENGNLLRTCMTKGKLSSGGGEGGRIEEYDWNDKLVWSLDFSTETYMQHHDIKRLPNGNIIMLVIEKKTTNECLAAGFDPSKFQPEIQQKGMMLPDYIVEIKPTYPSGGTVVWEWHTWDHLIQDFDTTKSNYGTPKSHPELVDCDGDGKKLPAFWNHMNSIDYNPELNQIALSVRGNSEVWIIDHSTTTEEAKGHSGGARGKGGDLLYRWGNPAAYGAGTVKDQRYFQQHDVEWVLPGRPGEGNLTCFNNGLGRGDYSSVDEFTPNIDENGNYAVNPGSAFSPANFVWTYKGSADGLKYSENISGAYRLPNGNTLMCSGTVGQFVEVTSAGEIVWEYICPVDQTGRLNQGDTLKTDLARPAEKMNSVFRVYKYAPDYPAFAGRDLTPGEFVELYLGAVNENEIKSLSNYPNPFNNETVIKYELPFSGNVKLELFDSKGTKISTLVDEYQQAGTYSLPFSADQLYLTNGVYFYKLSTNDSSETNSIVFIK
ncbi:MAG: aryl-sulfate sulfotransferase [bacterium]